MLAIVSADEVAATVFIDIAVILIAARLMGRLARRLGQPSVVGEILAGIALGPSLLGALPGHLPVHLFPTTARPFLQVVAQLGLIMFMFIVGLELDLGLIQGKGRTAAVISLSSIALPFALGFPLAVVLHRTHAVVAGKTVDFLPFALFIGASMSVTAFPVLARILNERRMLQTPVGALTLACAAVDDVLAWSLLAVVLAVVASAGAWDLPRILVESAAFVAVMVLVARPVLQRLVADRYRRGGRLTPEIMAVVLIGMLAASYATAKIGIHQIFGAFLFGAVMPRDTGSELRTQVLERLETVSVLLLLPVFFVTTGLNVDIRGIGAKGAGELGLILLVAVSGKFLGAVAGARSQGIKGRRAMTIGTLMNTRGLTELVILNVGLAFGVLDRPLFTMLVVMAVVTTVMTEPILRITYPASLRQADTAAAAQAQVGPVEGRRVLVSIGDPAHARRMVDLAADLVSGDAGEVVLTRFSPRARSTEVGSGTVADREQGTAWMAELHALAEHAEARGVKTVALYQFSDDVAADLVAQAGSVGAGLLLVGRPRAGDDAGRAALDRFAMETGLDYEDFVRRVLASSPCPVGVVAHPYPGVASDVPVVAVGDGSADSAARGLAERIAQARQVQAESAEAVRPGQAGLVVVDGAGAEQALRAAAGAVLAVSPPATGPAASPTSPAEGRSHPEAARPAPPAGSGRPD